MEAACNRALDEFQKGAQWVPEVAQAADELLENVLRVGWFVPSSSSTAVKAASSKDSATSRAGVACGEASRLSIDILEASDLVSDMSPKRAVSCCVSSCCVACLCSGCVQASRPGSSATQSYCAFMAC
jgi:hypothetical protein